MTPEILLKAYVQYQSEDAFRELVAGTLDEVYSTSLRIVGTPHLASEVAVRVYWDLARKAPRLGKDVTLASWLRERTCKLAVTVLRAEDRPVDRAALKKEKEASPAIVGPAPTGLALRICNGLFLSRARRRGLGISLPAFQWPAWIRPRHLGGMAVCALAIVVWWNNPFHHRNRIIKFEGLQLKPTSFAQLANPPDAGPLTPGNMTNNTNAETNPTQK